MNAETNYDDLISEHPAYADEIRAAAGSGVDLEDDFQEPSADSDTPTNGEHILEGFTALARRFVLAEKQLGNSPNGSVSAINSLQARTSLLLKRERYSRSFITALASVQEATMRAADGLPERDFSATVERASRDMQRILKGKGGNGRENIVNGIREIAGTISSAIETNTGYRLEESSEETE